MFYRPLLLLSILLSALCCSAQSGPFADKLSSIPFRSTVSGIVQDNADRPVNGARVDIQDVNTGHTLAGTFSLANGAFEITNLRNGTYQIVVTCGMAEQRTQIEV